MRSCFELRSHFQGFRTCRMDVARTLISIVYSHETVASAYCLLGPAEVFVVGDRAFGDPAAGVSRMPALLPDLLALHGSRMWMSHDCLSAHSRSHNGERVLKNLMFSNTYYKARGLLSPLNHRYRHRLHQRPFAARECFASLSQTPSNPRHFDSHPPRPSAACEHCTACD